MQCFASEQDEDGDVDMDYPAEGREDEEEEDGDYDLHDHDEDDEEEDEDHDEHEDDEHDEHDDDEEHDEDEEDEDHDHILVRNRLFSQAHQLFGNLSSGFFSEFASRSRLILNAIRDRDDVSTVMQGLQDLADILLVSTEDIVEADFPVDKIAQELVNILGDSLFEANPEILLVACENVSNLVEAVPLSAGSLVHAGVVSLLCQKLFEIQYIDLAERALSVSRQI